MQSYRRRISLDNSPNPGYSLIYEGKDDGEMRYALTEDLFLINDIIPSIVGDGEEGIWDLGPLDYLATDYNDEIEEIIGIAIYYDHPSLEKMCFSGDRSVFLDLTEEGFGIIELDTRRGNDDDSFASNGDNRVTWVGPGEQNRVFFKGMSRLSDSLRFFSASAPPE